MDFARRITRTPLPFDPARGAEARATLPDLPPELGDLLAGAAGCSPYLAGLIGRERDWLQQALAGPPEAAFDALLEIGDEGEEPLRAALRQAKRRAALLIALADLGGVWGLEQVTGALTRLADRATDLALGFQIGREAARGKLPGLPGLPADDPAAAARATGTVAIAMGKMGAGELNYSSDIDLIMLFDESRHDPADFHDIRAGLIRATRRMVRMLSDNTHEGYVFRTDLRLRPDPSVTPVCLSMEAAERYYESLGRTWERAAWIKARPAAGDTAAGADFIGRLRPFVWRRYLDFAAIEDAHDIRLAIRQHKGTGGAIVLAGHDVKLGRGGIREIEFFTQTRQLIAGGRDPDLRPRATQAALAALAGKGWVPDDVARRLSAHYRFLRTVEHRLQMVHDAQTHKLPGDDDGFRRLAMMMGKTDPDALQRRLTDTFEEVHALTEGFFAPGHAAPPAAAAPDPQAAPQAAPQSTLQTDPQTEEIVARWPGYAALRSERARRIFDRLRPDLLARLGAADRPREALLAFDGFLQGLPAGVQIFSLFQANPQLIDLIVDIAATAPDLARYLGRNSAVLDAVIGGDFFAPWPGEAALRADLAARLGAAADYEAALAEARRWRREWHFRIGVHHLRGLIGADEAGGQYADLAGAVLAALWPVVVDQFARRHGAPPGQGAVVIGMGSLGAGRLNAASDLDLLVIYDPAGAEGSDGPKPLATRPYFARLTQAFITALSAPMAEGRLYEVDMRLRPSGRQGPVATSISAFRDYQLREAWTWEHLALSRARPVAGSADLGAAVSAVRDEVLARGCPPGRLARDVADMRARILAAKGDGAGAFEAKLGPGRLQDVELAAQAALLRAGGGPRDTPGQIAAAAAAGVLRAPEARALAQAQALFWRLQAGLRLLMGEGADGAARDLGQGGQAFLLRELGAGDMAGLERMLAGAATAAAGAIADFLARLETEGGDED